MIGKAEFFFEPLIAKYVDDKSFIARRWLSDRIVAHLEHSTQQIVLLIGEPGAGKTSLLAHIARLDPTTLRYFLRSDSRLPAASGSARSFLGRVGHQLATLRPELFVSDRRSITVEQDIGALGVGGRLVGISVDKLVVSPFYQTAIHVKQQIDIADGEIIGIEAAQVVADEQLLDLADLAHLALQGPAEQLAIQQPEEAIRIIIDGLDELRFRREELSVLDWLVTSPEFPGNIQFILSCRKDDDILQKLSQLGQGAMIVETIDPDASEVRNDVAAYIQRSVTNLSQAPAAEFSIGGAARLTAEIERSAAGNFQYVAAFFATLNDAIVAHNFRLASNLVTQSRLPDTLTELYAFFLNLVRDSAHEMRVPISDSSDEHAWVPAWSTLFRPILEVLAVAREPVGRDEIGYLAGLEVQQSWIDEALRMLDQFIDSGIHERGRIQLYHQSLVDFIVGKESLEDYPSLHINSTAAEQLLVNRAVQKFKGAWHDAGVYIQRQLTSHAVAAGLSELMMNDPMFLAYAEPGGLVTAAASTFGVGADIVQQSATMLHTCAPSERLAYLELAALQSGAHDFAELTHSVPHYRPWSVRWAQWRRTDRHRTIGRFPQWNEKFGVAEVHHKMAVIFSDIDSKTAEARDLISGAKLQSIRSPNGLPLGRNVTVGRCGDRTLAVFESHAWRDDHPDIRTNTTVLKIVDIDDDSMTYPSIVDLPVNLDYSLGENSEGELTVTTCGQYALGILGMETPGIAVRAWRIVGSEWVSEIIWESHSDYNHISFVPSPERLVAIAWGARSFQAIDAITGEVIGPEIRHGLGEDTDSEWARSVGPMYGCTAIGQRAGRVVLAVGLSERMHPPAWAVLRLYDLASGTLVWELQQDRDALNVAAIGAVNGKATLAVAGYSGEIHLVDLDQGAPARAPLVGHHGYVTVLEFVELGDKPALVSAGNDETIRVWSFDQKDHSASFTQEESEHTLGISLRKIDDMHLVAVWSAPKAASEQSKLTIWEIGNGTLIAEHDLTAPGNLSGGMIHLCEMDANYPSLLILLNKVARLLTWRFLTRDTQPEELSSLPETPDLEYWRDYYNVAVAEVDGSPVVAAGLVSGSEGVVSWRPGGKEVRLGPPAAPAQPIHRLALGHSGRRLIAAMNHDYFDPVTKIWSGGIHIYDLATGQEVDAYGPPDEFYLLEILQEGDNAWTAITQNSDAGMDEVYVRRVLFPEGASEAASPETLVLAGHPGGVTALASGSMAGQSLIFTGDRTGILHIWNYEGKHICNVHIGGQIIQIRVGSDNLIAVATRAGSLVLSFEPEALQITEEDPS